MAVIVDDLNDTRSAQRACAFDRFWYSAHRFRYGQTGSHRPRRGKPEAADRNCTTIAGELIATWRTSPVSATRTFRAIERDAGRAARHGPPGSRTGSVTQSPIHVRHCMQANTAIISNGTSGSSNSRGPVPTWLVYARHESTPSITVIQTVEDMESWRARQLSTPCGAPNDAHSMIHGVK